MPRQGLDQKRLLETAFSEGRAEFEDVISRYPTERFYAFRVKWDYNGQFHGKGQYLTGARIFANGHPQWGCSVNMDASFDPPKNIGTDDNQIAFIGFKITIQVSNVTQNFTWNIIGSIQGNGAGQMKPTW
jgi:hypothetical protein